LQCFLGGRISTKKGPIWTRVDGNLICLVQ
jgi:hypothetical protein